MDGSFLVAIKFNYWSLNRRKPYFPLLEFTPDDSNVIKKWQKNTITGQDTIGN